MAKDPVLEKALKKCKDLNGDKNKKANFVLIPKGQEGKLIVSLKRITDQQVKCERDKIKGSTPVKGKCFGPPESMTFEVKKDSSTLAGALKKIAQRDASMKITPAVKETDDAEADQAPVDGAEPATKEEVMARLATLTPAYKRIVGLTGPNIDEIKTLVESIRELAGKKDFAGASKALDQVEPLVDAAMAQVEEETAKVVQRAQELDATLKELSKNPNAANLAPKLKATEKRIQDAIKKVGPPSHDLVGGQAALTEAETAIAAIPKWFEKYQEVLDAKKVTDAKVAEVEGHKHAKGFKKEVKAIKDKVPVAMKKADPPGNDYAGALADLGAVNTECAALLEKFARYEEYLTKQKEVETKVAGLAGAEYPDHTGAKVTEAKTKLAEATKLAAPPAKDYVGALTALTAAEAACAAVPKIVEDYKKVLAKKTEVEGKVTTLEGHALAGNVGPQKKLAELKTGIADAVKKADPPTFDYAGAIAALAAIEAACALLPKMFEEYQRVLDNKKHIEKKIAALGSHKYADKIKPKLDSSASDLAAAVALADPPTSNTGLALSAIEAVYTALEEGLAAYESVLAKKADTDKKIDRLDKHPQKNLITAEITAIKAALGPAVAKADPPASDFHGALRALAGVDKLCAAAEVKIFDEMVKGKTRDQMEAEMKKIFKARFGVELEMEASGDTQAEELKSMKRVYELMAQVPESHATNNPSLKQVDRFGGPSDTSYYTSYTQKTTKTVTKPWDIFGLFSKKVVTEKDIKKMVLKCGRPEGGSTRDLQDGLGDPPIEPDCDVPAGVDKTKQDYFDWTTLHEIGHAVDDRKKFMDTNGKKAEYGGWEVYNKDVSIPAAAVGEKFNFKTTEAIVYIKALMTGAANSRPTTKPPRPSDRTVADWNQAQKDVEDWVDSARDGKKPWYTIPKDFGGRIYHEAYVEYGTWVSYLKAARARGVKGYQFRAPPEWFAELYAAYHMGTLKDSHPMIKLFLRDL